MLGAGALGRPRGMEGGGRREEGSGWGMHVYLWWIHFDIWQNKYNYVKFKNKIKLKKKTSNFYYSNCVFVCIDMLLMLWPYFLNMYLSQAENTQIG